MTAVLPSRALITPNFCVCVPARDEQLRLPILLDALAAQTVGGTISVAVCVNNSSDDSVLVAQEAATRHHGRLDIALEACQFTTGLAHAGSARGRAMTMGLARIGGSGVLLSTDADCRPPIDWIAANLAAIEIGADIVGGRIVLDDAEPLDPAIVILRARFDRYWAAVRAIEDAIDPSPHDPAPRHGDHTGASIAIDAALFRAIGGVRPIASGEDRMMVIDAVAAGGRLVHPPSVWTRVSARTDGRAEGGMAVAMAELATLSSGGRDPLVPAFAHWRTRSRWRREQRAAHGTAAMLAREATLPPMPVDTSLSHAVAVISASIPTLASDLAP